MFNVTNLYHAIFMQYVYIFCCRTVKVEDYRVKLVEILSAQHVSFACFYVLFLYVPYIILSYRSQGISQSSTRYKVQYFFRYANNVYGCLQNTSGDSVIICVMQLMSVYRLFTCMCFYFDRFSFNPLPSIPSVLLVSVLSSSEAFYSIFSSFFSCTRLELVFFQFFFYIVFCGEKLEKSMIWHRTPHQLLTVTLHQIEVYVLTFTECFLEQCTG